MQRKQRRRQAAGMKAIAMGLGAVAFLLMTFLAVVIFTAVISVTFPKRSDAGTGTNAVRVTIAGTKDSTNEPTNMRSDLLTMLTGTEGIPIYPRAQQLSGGEKAGPYTGLYSFATMASMDDVAAFYRQELATAGWVITSEITFGNSISMDFTWTNPANEVPLRCYLHTQLSTSSPTAKFPFRTSISLDFARWPDPNQVPLYPNAQQVEIKDGSEPGYGDQQRVITYETEAGAPDVEAYYREAMVQHGWQMTKTTPNPLIFVYSHLLPAPSVKNSEPTPTGLPKRIDKLYGTGSVVHVSIFGEETSNAKTKVELWVSGDEVKP